MTLILTIVSPFEVVHVSDRQVSLRDGRGRTSIHSPLENKTIIILGKDVVAVAGYTGSAYVGGKPTDEWLAEVIADRPLDEGLAGIGGRSTLRINAIIWRIRKALERGALPSGGTITICVGGYRNRRGRVVPFLAEISWPDFTKSFFNMRLPRSRQETLGISAIGDPPGWDELMATVREGPSLRDGLVRTLRNRAEQSDLVGPNLMAVRIPHPSQRLIEWEFMPAEQHRAELQTPDKVVSFEAFYSPWVISGGQTHAPGVGTGHFTLYDSCWTIAPIEQPQAREGGVLFAVSRQRRVPDVGGHGSEGSESDGPPPAEEPGPAPSPQP